MKVVARTKAHVDAGGCHLRINGPDHTHSASCGILGGILDPNLVRIWDRPGRVLVGDNNCVDSCDIHLEA